MTRFLMALVFAGFVFGVSASHAHAASLEMPPVEVDTGRAPKEPRPEREDFPAALPSEPRVPRPWATQLRRGRNR